MKLKVGLIDYSTCCFEVLMQKTTSIIFILLCFLSSCSFESKTEFPAFDKEIRVDGEQSDTELLINMGWIDCVDTFLVMTHVAQNDFCHVYSIPSGMKKIHTWGSLGNGPGEFLQPIITYAHENTFGLNDVNIQMLAVMSLKGNGNAIEIEELSRKKLLISVFKVSSILQIIISYDWMNSILSPYCAERTVVSFPYWMPICSLYRGSANLRWGTKFLSSLHG